uniref:Jacalin-type lectin domain-containing protein n=1 Tax=Setaria italica TaxID=4555 RepID=K4AL85_SETIT
MDDIQARTAANGGDGLARYARDPSAGCTVLPLRLRFSLCHGGSGARGCGVYLAPDAADIIKDLVLVNRLKSTLPAGGVVKIGPWGGEGGLHWDIPAMATPLRLDSITVCSSLAVVDAISFRYWDAQGVKHDAGPWGGNDGDPYVIALEPSEFLTEVSGTFAYIGTQPTDAVTSLTFVTNLRKHGPFGDVDGTPFSVPVRDGGRIVALFGRGWDYIDAIGVYGSARGRRRARLGAWQLSETGWRMTRGAKRVSGAWGQAHRVEQREACSQARSGARGKVSDARGMGARFHGPDARFDGDQARFDGGRPRCIQA